MTERSMRKTLGLALGAALAASLALGGCSKKEETPSTATTPAPAPAASPAPTPPAAPTDREIKIASIKPDSETLKTGETVKLALRAAYVLPAQGGSVGIVVQDARSALIANKLVPVEGGSGMVVEELEFKVPATDKLVVHVPLYLKGDTKSSTVASHSYSVKPK